MSENIISPKVSVIVPMFNCSPFLPAFFQDMQNQSLREFEIICVIDGATDNTLDIVKEYAVNDSRIRFFYKENGGAGTARNYGLDHACGEYVIWIDADDRYSPDFLGEMASAADKFKADEVLCLCDSYDYTLRATRQSIGFDREAFPENTCVNPSDIPGVFKRIGSGPTNKLYRRSFVADNQLCYSSTRVANDVKFILSAISVARRVVGVHKHLATFQRNINPESITSNRGKYTHEVPSIYTELYQWLTERNLFEQNREMFCTYFSDGIFYNSQFAVNPQFIDAAVHSLNEEEPWASMSPAEVAKVFGKYFNLKKLKDDIITLETNIQENIKEPDQSSKVKLERMKNRLEVIALIKTLSSVRYNRDFDEYRFAKLKKQLKNKDLQLEITKQQLQREKSSWNYKIGSAILWLPKKILYLFKRKGEEST